MHKHVTPLLVLLTLIFGGVYLAFLANTISLAKQVTEIERDSRAIEQSIALLEQSYYSATAKLHGIDLEERGYELPETITYVSHEGDTIEVSKAP